MQVKYHFGLKKKRNVYDTRIIIKSIYTFSEHVGILCIYQNYKYFHQYFMNINGYAFMILKKCEQQINVQRS